MGRKSRRKRERRAVQYGLSGIEEVTPINWALMEVLAKRISRHRRDNPHLFYGSFDSQPEAAEPAAITEADVIETFERFTARL